MTSTSHLTRNHIQIFGDNAPSPKESFVEYNPDDKTAVKHTDCKNYVYCLDMACDAGWDGFVCTDCTAFTALTEDEQVRQGIRIAATIRKRRTRE